jgi:L-lactate dehydrogenase (cytochrome)
LIGCSSVDQLNPTLVDTRGLNMHTTNVPVDTLVSLESVSFQIFH